MKGELQKSKSNLLDLNNQQLKEEFRQQLLQDDLLKSNEIHNYGSVINLNQKLMKEINHEI